MGNTIIQPGGESATSLNPPAPPSPAPAPASSSWTVEYDLDLTAQPAHNFAPTPGGDGPTALLGGVTWTAYNEGSADKLVLSSAGLEIDPKGDGSHAWAQVLSLPYLSAKLTDMMVGLAEDDTIALQLYMDSSPAPAAATDAYGMALWNGLVPVPPPTSQTVSKYLLLRQGFTGSPGAKKVDSFIAAGSYDSMAQATDQTFFEIVLYPGNGAVANIGVFGADFPLPLTTGTFQTYVSLSPEIGPGGGNAFAVPAWNIPKEEARLMIHAQRAGSTTILTTTSYKLRVLRRNNT